MAERSELLRLVSLLMSGSGTEQEQDAALAELRAQVAHPRVSSLVFWPEREGLGPAPTPEEVVDAALAYRPIEL